MVDQPTNYVGDTPLKRNTGSLEAIIDSDLFAQPTLHSLMFVYSKLCKTVTQKAPAVVFDSSTSSNLKNIKSETRCRSR